MTEGTALPNTRALRAHMIQSWDGTEWQVFVALPNEARWPTGPFPIGDGVPTLDARSKALASLGFTPLEGDTAWEWMETLEGEPGGVIALVATTTVAPSNPDHS